MRGTVRAQGPRCAQARTWAGKGGAQNGGCRAWRPARPRRRQPVGQQLMGLFRLHSVLHQSPAWRARCGRGQGLGEQQALGGAEGGRCAQSADVPSGTWPSRWGAPTEESGCSRPCRGWGGFGWGVTPAPRPRRPTERWGARLRCPDPPEDAGHGVRLGRVGSSPTGPRGSRVGRGCRGRRAGAGRGGRGAGRGGASAGPAHCPARGPAAPPAGRTLAPRRPRPARGRPAAAPGLRGEGGGQGVQEGGPLRTDPLRLHTAPLPQRRHLSGRTHTLARGDSPWNRESSRSWLKRLGLL